jgi:DNA repair protein RadA/Sms
MLLAVLEKRCGFSLGQKDVFVNLAGGIRLEDPALDLSLVAAIVSSLYNLPVDSQTAFAAEVSLTGEVRGVGKLEARIQEAAKLGFQRMLISAHSEKGLQNRPKGIEVIGLARLEEVFQMVFRQ